MEAQMHAEEIGTSEPRDTILTAEWLWDGTGRPPIRDGAVAIGGSRILAVGTHQEITSRAGQHATVVAFPRATVLPGLIDTHVHLVWPGDGTPAWAYTASATDADLLLRAAQNARLALSAGVTTLRDVGSRGRVVLDLRDAIQEGLMVGPRILASGAPVTTRGGHMHYLGGEADTTDEVRRQIRTAWRSGVDFVKLVANGGGTPRTYPWIPAYSPEDVAVAVSEAHSRQTYLVAHANATEAIRAVVQAGGDGIEHCTFLQGPGRVVFDSALAEEIARKGVYVGHTLQAAYRSIERALAHWDKLEPEERAAVDIRRRTNDVQYENCGRLLQIGVNLVASTDAGWSLNPFGEYWLAMELFVRSGATTIQALTSGTRLAAEALRVSDTIGTLESGKLADLAIFDGNPIEQIEDLRRARAVMRNGQMLVQDGRLLP
jgi:imidazolonepropionase-like amidohydrolase